MKWLVSLHEARTWLRGDIGLGGVGGFRLIKKLNSMTDGYGTDITTIKDLPRDLLEPSGTYKKGGANDDDETL